MPVQARENQSNYKLTVRLLGSISLEPNEGPPLTRGAKELLAFLLLSGQKSRAIIAAALWSETESSQALYNLRRALSELRRNLGSNARFLKTPNSREIEFDTSECFVDLFEFREALSKGAYEDAAKYCLLAPLGGATSPWSHRLRSQIRQEFAKCSELVELNTVGNSLALAESHRVKSGRADVPSQNSPLGESFDEDPVQQRTEVLPSDRRIGPTLKQRMGGLEAGSVPTARSHRNQPSRPLIALGGLVGRDVFLAQLAHDLREHRLVTVFGIGGLGKTRVAVELLDRVEQEFPDGTVFVDLTPACDRLEACEAIVKALQIQVDRGPSWRQVIEWMSTKKLLLLLDNAEHLLGPVAEIVGDLVSYTQSPRILVTSRAPLGLPIERRRRLMPLQADDSRRLFEQRASVVFPEYKWSRDSQSLCRQLDGIPLAIELTAAQVGSVALSDLSASLTRSLTLDSIGESRHQRHQTMRAALIVSFAALPSETKVKLVQLSIFEGGFCAAAARDIVKLSTAEITRLTNSSLLEFDGDRYRMLEPVRQLASELLGDGDGLQSLKQIHAEWYARQALEAYSDPFPYDLDPRRYATERTRWQQESANVRAAVEHLETIGLGTSDRAFSLWLVQVWFRLVDLTFIFAEEWLNRWQAEPVEDSVRSATSANWWLTVGLLAIWNDNETRSYPLLRRLFDAAYEVDQLKVCAHVAMSLAEHPVLSPFSNKELTGFEVARELFEAIGDARGVRHAQILWATHQAVGEVEESLWKLVDEIEQDAEWNREVNIQAIALRLIAKKYQDWPERRAQYLRALNVQRSVGHWAEIHTLRSMAMSARTYALPCEEAAIWEESISRAEALGYFGNLGESHLELARAYWRGSELGGMWVEVHKALCLIQNQERPRFLHQVMAHLAQMLELSGAEEDSRELSSYIRRAADRGLFELHEKFEELVPGISHPDWDTKPRRFRSAEDVIGWVSEQARAFEVSNPGPAAYLR